MNKTITSVIALLLISPVSAFAYNLPSKVDVTTAYRSGQGAVDFTKSSSLKGTFTISESTYDKGEYIAAGDIGHGASGYGFFAKNGELFAVTSDGSTQVRIPIAYFKAGTEIEVEAHYSPTTSRIDFSGKSYDESINDFLYPSGVFLDYLPQNQAIAADPISVLINPQDYGSTVLSVISWQYTN